MTDNIRTLRAKAKDPTGCPAAGEISQQAQVDSNGARHQWSAGGSRNGAGCDCPP